MTPREKVAAPAKSMSMTTHTTLRAANIARQIEWDQDNQITAAYRGNELAGEVGEACNVIKKLERERLGILGSRATVAELADELADVVICADLIAMHYGIDLEAAVARKFNATSEKVGLATRLAPADGGEA
jgi:NTP pyrophosphatase (non-canonical NTP hydrolase)